MEFVFSCYTIDCFLDIIAFSGEGFIVAMICPVIIPGITDDQEVAILVIRQSENVFIHYRYLTFDGITAITITIIIIPVALKPGSVHHNKTDSFCTIIIGAF